MGYTTKAIHLTSGERKAYLKLLSPNQRKVLNEYRKFKYNSEVLTEFSKSGGDWKFLEMKVNYDYDSTHPQDSFLKCSCGKGVKYLYYCQSNITGEVLGFGSDHLKQEAGISNAVVREILNGQHRIDRGLDEILYWYAKGETFPSLKYEFVQTFAYSYEIEEFFKSKDLQFLEAFKKQDLPIYGKDYKKLDKLVEKVDSRKTREEYERRRAERERKHKIEEERRRRIEEQKRKEEEKRRQEIERKRAEEERKAKIEKEKREAKIKKLKENFEIYLSEQNKWKEKQQSLLENKINKLNNPNREKALYREFATISDKRKELIRKAIILFDRIFDKETTEMYALNINDCTSILILYGMLNQGKVKVGEEVNLPETTIGFVIRLANKFEYPVLKVRETLYKLYNKFLNILISKRILKRKAYKVVYNFNLTL